MLNMSIKPFQNHFTSVYFLSRRKEVLDAFLHQNYLQKQKKSPKLF